MPFKTKLLQAAEVISSVNQVMACFQEAALETYSSGQ